MDNMLLKRMAATVVSALPTDRTESDVRYWEGNPTELRLRMKECLRVPVSGRASDARHPIAPCCPEPLLEHLPLKVNYNRSVTDLIEQGKYGYVSLDAKRFPASGKGKVTREAVLVQFQFKKSKQGRVVLELLNQMGLRPADNHELLSLGATYRDYPGPTKNHRIVQLGQTIDSHGYPAVSSLYPSTNGRCIELWSPNKDWSIRTYFLAFER